MNTKALTNATPDTPEVPRRQRILIAVDDSAPSHWAVRYGGELAERLGGRVMLLHVVVPDTSVVDQPRTQEALDQESRAEGEKLLERVAALLPPAVSFDCMQLEGAPAEEIVGAAHVWEADLIVLGTRGRGRVAQFLLGSVAEAVIRRATCPVLTLGHEPVARESRDADKAYELA